MSNPYIKLQDLNEDQVEFLVERFAIRRPITEIKQWFTQLFDGRTMLGEDFVKFSKVYKSEIGRKAKEVLNDVNAAPLSFARVRMDELGYALDIAKKGELRSRKVSKEVLDKNGDLKFAEIWEEYREINPSKIKDIVEAAQKEAFLSEKIKLEMIAKGYLNMERQAGIQPVQVRIKGDAESPIIETTVTLVED